MSLLVVDRVRKSFGAVRAVDDVSFALAKGELLALIGPNGAGKSTLFNLINGQLQPDQGDIRLGSGSLVGLSPQAIWQHGVGRTFQIAQTFASLSVLENVQTVLLSRAGKLFSLWSRADRIQAERAMGLLEQVGMAPHAARPCSALAYGDVKERHALMALVRGLAGQRNMAVLFTEHSMDVVFGYAQRVLVLAGGRLIAQGDPQQVQDDAQVRRVYLGSASFGVQKGRT